MKKSKIIGVISAVCLVLIAIIAACLIIIFKPWSGSIIGGWQEAEIPEAFMVRSQCKENNITYCLYGVNGDFMVYDVSYDKDYTVEDLVNEYESGQLINKVDVYKKISNIEDLDKTVKKYKKALKGDLELESWADEYSLCMEYPVRSTSYYGLFYDDNHIIESVLLDAYFNESGRYLKNNKQMDEVIDWLKNSVQFEEEIIEKRNISITSKEDMLNISDEDLIYLAKNIKNFKTRDLVADFTGLEIEDFGIPLEEDADYSERYEPYLLNPGVTRSELDINKQLPREEFQKLVDDFSDNLIDSNDGIKNRCEAIYCGETDQYVEYKYTIVSKYTTNGEETETTYHSRRCFYRNIFMVESDDHKSAGSLYIGEVTPDKICEMEDYLFANFGEVLIYREVEESEQAVTYIAYIPEIEHGESSEDTKVVIIKREIAYDKETHEQTVKESIVKSVDLHK